MAGDSDVGAEPGRSWALGRDAERRLAEAPAASADWLARDAGWDAREEGDRRRRRSGGGAGRRRRGGLEAGLGPGAGRGDYLEMAGDRV